MKKEKSVRTYQRKSKNGKIVTVHSYKAKYDAAEEARKEMAKRAGAGDELKKKKSSAPADLGFTADEFKIWANDLDAKEAKRIDKILVKRYGEKAVQKLADEINAGNSRTHKTVFARLTSEDIKNQKKSSKDVNKLGQETNTPRRASNSNNANADWDSKVKEAQAIIAEHEKRQANAKEDAYRAKQDREAEKRARQQAKLQAKIDERKGKFIVSSSGKPLKNAVNAAIAKAKKEAYIEKSPYKDVLKRYAGDALVSVLQRRGVEYKKAVSISNRLQALRAQERSVTVRPKSTRTKSDKLSKAASSTKAFNTTNVSKVASSAETGKKPKSSPTGKWVITYNEKTPMGLSSSKDRKVIVEAKTMRGAEGIYKKQYHRGSDSAYATTLYNITPYEG